MAGNTERLLKTGGDPRALADFTALRGELNKLAHPARPDVDWVRVEQLCLALFRQNGVELQTAVDLPWHERTPLGWRAYVKGWNCWRVGLPSMAWVMATANACPGGVTGLVERPAAASVAHHDAVLR